MFEDTFRNGKRSSSWLQGCHDRWREITAPTRRENKMYVGTNQIYRKELYLMQRRCIEHINSRTRSRDHRASSPRAKRNRLLRDAVGKTVETEAKLSFPQAGYVTPGKTWKNLVLPVIPVFYLHDDNAASRPDDCWQWREMKATTERGVGKERRHVDTL